MSISSSKFLILAITISLMLFSQAQLSAQGSLIKSGPMVGHVDMRQAKIWLQTTSPVEVFVVYFDSANTARRFRTNILRTSSELSYTAKLIADSIEPGKTYFYEVWASGKKVERPYPLRFRSAPLWRWRGSAPNVRFALGSCAYINEPAYDRPGKPYGGGEQIFESIKETKPDIMLWLGDNTYLREADWNTRTGIMNRYTHDRSIPQLQPLIGGCSNIAIWDDHDYGPNDSDRGFFNKEETLRAFNLFWANPTIGMSSAERGITSSLQWADVDVFLLDNRWYRSPDKRVTGEKTILGKSQLQWLIDNLVSSNATFKFVCIGGQVLNSSAIYENYAVYAEERAHLIEAIQKENIKGVVFLTGDRHHTELSLMKLPGQVAIYDFTVSPLTSSANTKAKTEENSFRVDGTFVGERNFATIDVVGDDKERKLLLTVYDSNGKSLWQKSISSKDFEK